MPFSRLVFNFHCADFSHLLSVYWLSGRNAGAGVARPEERAILLPLPQKDTVSAGLSVLGCIPYLFACDLPT